ncbi:transmembrane protein 147 [Maniola jurtina]|uniref:transmembrane protein 147 n=1 Tax=Maniola jurtina TaxID=191418 RepID=UPI001E688AF2|nr:transmembrane protein 147 [Maniola jurtina]XP_045768367.1 transmembrane protein 147 [Maniola jurtina]
MTLYHFGNCLALVYAPYHMAYKFSGISEYATFSKCVYAGGLYIFTQLCKMLLLATFFPDSDNIHSGGDNNVFLEILKATVDLADLLGIYIALNSIPGKGHAKILTAAIGWASAEVLVSRSVLLWVGARGSEFDWRYVRACAESNVALLQHAATAALVWLCARSDLPRHLLPRAAGLLLLVPYRALLEDAIAHALGLSAWALLWMRAAHAAGVGLAALALYAAHQQQ